MKGTVHTVVFSLFSILIVVQEDRRPDRFSLPFISSQSG